MPGLQMMPSRRQGCMMPSGCNITRPPSFATRRKKLGLSVPSSAMQSPAPVTQYFEDKFTKSGLGLELPGLFVLELHRYESRKYQTCAKRHR
jgi:hypothetical protein